MNTTTRRFLHIAITLAFVALGALGLRTLTATKPNLTKRQRHIPVPVVRAITVRTARQSVHIVGEGTVRPLREISIVPQVSGNVVYTAPALVNGGEFQQGETLLRIDPVDYELAVTLAESKVKDAESNLSLVKEDAVAARHEWRLLHADGPDATREPPPLVAKEPQLAAAQARLEADRADLRKAVLNVERTVLQAPFDGRISEKNVDIGQYVSLGQTLASLYSIETVEIVIPLEDDALSWFHVPGFTPGDGPGARAVVRAHIAGQERSWSGEVIRAQGKLDERTRMIDIVVRVHKPYATKPPLAPGLFATVDIEGRTLTNAQTIPRSALHQGDVAWVVDHDGLLHFRKVKVARVHGNEAIIESGLKDGEVVAISPFEAPTDGMSVRTALVTEVNGS